MNKRKFTKRKGSKTKTDNVPAEVFVLPPNLLEQLGINLGNIGSSPESSTVSQVTDMNNIICRGKGGTYNTHTPTKHSGHDVSTSSGMQSSFIETAELMKKSVFLSPTFVSNTSVIQGEIEIIDNADREGISEKVNVGLINNESNKKTEYMQKACVSEVHKPNSIPISVSTQENKESDTIANVNVELHDIKIQKVVDDHADEAYSSDCSNSNIECADKTNLKKSNQNKINIISEQVILPSQIYKLDCAYSSQRNALVRVSIDTVIKSHKKDSIRPQNVLNMDAIPNLTVDIGSTETTVNEFYKYEHNYVKENTNISTMDSQVMQHIGKTDACAELNETDSDLIITPHNEADPQRNNVILQMFKQKDANIKDKVTVDTSVGISWHVDIDEVSEIIIKGRDKVGNETNTEIHNEHNEDKGKETSNAITIDSCVDGIEGINFMLTSNGSKSEMVQDNDTVMPCVSDVANGSKNIKKTPEDLSSHTENNINMERSPPYPEVLLNIKELKTSEQKTDKQIVEAQNGNYFENDIFFLDTLQTNYSIKANLSPCVDNCRRSRSIADTQKIKNQDKRSRDTYTKKRTQDKNTHVIHVIPETSSQSPVLKVENQGRGKHESDDAKCDQKEIFECSDPNEIKETYSENGLCGDNEELCSNNVKVDHINKNSVVLDEKVKEIAKYLSKFADLRKQNDFNGKQKIGSCKTLNNEKHATYSKSSIHGIEKPGGSGINNKQNKNYPRLNTYERRRSRRRKTAPTYVIGKSKTQSAQPINLADISSSYNICNEMELCLCYDFGRLMSYDSETSYEHIHFWNNVTTDYTPDLIFSIYNEDTPAVTIDNWVMSDIENYPSESSDTTFRKLCWNEINVIKDKRLDDVNDLDFKDKRKEHIGTYNQERDDSFSSKVNRENTENENEKERMCINQIITANLSQNDEVTPNNITNERSAKTGKKRKCSIVPTDNDEPPAKKFGHISKQSTQIKGTRYCIDKDQATANYVKTSAIVEVNPVKGSSTPLDGAKTNPLEEPSASLNKATTIEQSSHIPLDAIINSTEQSSTTMMDLVVRPSKIKEVPTISVEQPKIPANVVTTDQSSPTVHEYRTIICGVCQQKVEDVDWLKHIAYQHKYLAWKRGEPSLDVDDEAAVRDHLSHIVKSCGGLECMKCGLSRKHVKAYLNHIRRCSGLNEYSSKVVSGVKNDELCVKNEGVPISAELVKCGVCEESMQNIDWNDHITSRHNYLAWKLGEPSLDVSDEAAVREHLHEITKARSGLKCAKCGRSRKYVKAYLSHIRSCSGLNESQNDSTYDNVSSELIRVEELTGFNSNSMSENNVKRANTDVIKCGVCEECLQINDWNDHIASRHDYLAWKLGDSPLNVKDEAAVREHLYVISKACGGLTCAKCGLTRKYVKAYLSHVNSCNGLSESQNDSTYNISTDITPGLELDGLTNNPITDPIKEEQNASIDAALVECGVCKEVLQDKDWHCHIASRHDYLAWKLGETSLDVNDEEAVRGHLYEITKARGGLTCAKCGLTRKYVKAYLSHFRICNGPIDVNDSSSSVNLTPELRLKEEQVLTPAAVAEMVKCGVCGQYMESNGWVQHIATNHGYLAWRDGEPSFNVNDAEETRVHLQNLVKEIGALSCPKCGLQRKFVKSYLRHLRICGNDQEDKNDEDHHVQPNYSRKQDASSFKCGACNQIVENSLWSTHLSEEHNYLAWKDGDTPLNVDDEDEVYKHLYNFVKQFGSLICKYCGKSRIYVNPYLDHIRTCNQDVSQKSEAASPVSAPVDVSNGTLDLNDLVVDFASAGTCGVCNKEVEAGKWIQHTQKYHNYLAWREGDKPWDLDDFSDVNQYLYVICKRMRGLTCNKCGLVRKYVKSYLTHIKNCNVTDLNLDRAVCEGVGSVNNKAIYQCAMCKEQIEVAHWNTHAMEKHYNVTWIIGETPIDIKNPYVVERYLRDYKHVYGNLKCRTCGATRASFSGFYAHVITCGKTEEEIDMFRDVCEICNNKYLSIYKNQHAMIHKVQNYTAELKLKKEILKKEDAFPEERSGKRRAAVKARSVIEDYSNNMSKHLHTCQACGFGTDFKQELKKHRCDVSKEKDFSGDESSAAEIASSDDESPDSDVDSNISNEVNDTNEAVEDEDDDDEPHGPKKKIRCREPASALSKVARIPFKVEAPALYIKQGDEDFCNTHLTDDVLFPLWRREPETVPETELKRYQPSLEQSCKLKSRSGWTALERFEAKNDVNGISIFVGASIVCIAWAPLRLEHIYSGSSNFLAIACHNGEDCPRYQGDHTPKHENLIQIWNFSASRKLPEIVFGIAHDFGTVWSMDWCPSGARDPMPEDTEVPSARLGLLAVACSSGSAYIFTVPYPSTVVKNNQFIHKLKPVAELRMTMSSERKRFQATSVSWSKQKGHKIVLVGYGDGSTAYYDLLSASPLLSTMENDVQIFYPYYDERSHNTCITGTDLYPAAGAEAGLGAGACASAAPTGAALTARAGAGAGGAAGRARARLHVAALGVAFAPHAAFAVLTGDNAIMQTAISELVWVPPGRRLGSVRAAAGCARCGRVAASTPPALRVMRPHPAYADPKKQVIGMLEMTHLANKRKRVNDELAMTIEPLTYAEAVSKYGIEFKKVSRRDKVMQQQCAAKPKSHYPERFPLADVKSMAFCPSRKYHDKLAVATHSGILFLITID